MNKVSSVKEITNNLEKISGKVLYLFDIDNTIITTKSNFGPNIDKLKEVKKNHNDQSQIENLISQWRLSREVILTDNEWPHLLKTIEKPYALTKMDVGRFGEIPSMENWRNNELATLGIKFSPICPIDGEIYTEPEEIGVDNSTFFNGIFYTGNALKGDVVKKILTSHNYDSVVFVDDRPDQLEDVGGACEKLGVKYLPMQFIIEKQDYPIQSLAESESEKKIIDFLELHSHIS